MARKPKKPPLTGCKGSSHAPKHGGWLSWHWWHYSDRWTNTGKVLPFAEGTGGIRRSGWRCLDCGEFVGDQSDKKFAVVIGTSELATARAARIRNDD